MNFHDLPPVARFQTGIPVYISPQALFHNCRCNWCLRETADVHIFVNIGGTYTLCSSCTKSYEHIIVDFLARELSIKELESELQKTKRGKVIDFRHACAQRGEK